MSAGLFVHVLGRLTCASSVGGAIILCVTMQLSSQLISGKYKVPIWGQFFHVPMVFGIKICGFFPLNVKIDLYAVHNQSAASSNIDIFHSKTGHLLTTN